LPATTFVKQLATILLLLLLLFNFVGYRLLFDVLQQKANKELVAKLDNNQYNDADLITLTVPLSMPYLTDSKDFERKDGEIKNLQDLLNKKKTIPTYVWILIILVLIAGFLLGKFWQ